MVATQQVGKNDMGDLAKERLKAVVASYAKLL
jgi:hypothetical protein